MQQGIYLPSLRSEELGRVVLIVDTSGSCQSYLERFASEMQGILDAYDCELTICYADTRPQRVDKWQSSDGPLKLNMPGGGGTCHRWMTDWIAEQEEPPVCVVALTDLYTSHADRAPDVPVLWVCCGNDKGTAPFGTVTHIKE